MGHMSVTIDVAGLKADDYLFAASPLAELGSALHLITEPNDHPSRLGWVTAVSASVEPELLDRIIDLDLLWRPSRADMFLPSSPGPTLTAELDAVDALSDERWVSSALITSTCGTVALNRKLGSPVVDDRARELAGNHT
jgi:hypothetical protein